MTIVVTIPGLAGSPSLTALTLAAAEDALTIGTKHVGSRAQVSGLGVGFNLFTPTANCSYKLVLRGQDAATGAPTNAFVDLVELTATGVWVPTNSQANTLGAPGARTYANVAGALNIVVASGTTWYVDIIILRFPA